MQHMKITENLGEFQKFIDSDNKTGLCLEDTLNALCKALHNFFKEVKQYLQLGKCQCNSFDSQIGATTLSMMQYIILILYKQMHYGKSMGSLFDLLSSQAEEENITRYLL